MEGAFLFSAIQSINNIHLSVTFELTFVFSVHFTVLQSYREDRVDLDLY